MKSFVRSKNLILLGLLVLNHSLQALAGPTHVGNGDDGADLEKAQPVKSGRLLETRDKALALIDRLAVGGITGLGSLRPELARSELFLVEGSMPAALESDQGAFHSSMLGLVYARTLARPYAETRFFKSSLALSDDQLTALHIHEALHRSLAPEIRENENIVAQMTLAITSPSATHDTVSEVARRWIPATEREEKRVIPEIADIDSESSPIKNPSVLDYSFYTFLPNSDVASEFPINRMHILRSQLYPFGMSRSVVGIGIEASLIDRPKGTNAGPLGLSAHSKIWSNRDFEVVVFGQLSLNMLSSEELKNSPFGRDIQTVGLALEKTNSFFYVRNEISYTAPGEVKRTIGNIEYTDTYGSVFSAVVRAGIPLWKFKLGGYADIFLADFYRMSGGAFDTMDTGRFRIISGGPEVKFEMGSVFATLHGRVILNKNNDINFDYLGNLLVSGVQDGNLGLTLGVKF